MIDDSDRQGLKTDDRTHPTQYRLLFAVDVVGYGARSGPRKREVQKRVVDLATAVLSEIGVSDQDVVRQDAGDGTTVVLPAAVEVHRALPRLLNGWRDHLARDNEQYRDRIRIRLALAIGPIARAPLGFDGSTIVEVDRLLDSPPLRQAVADHPDADLVAMVSDQLHHDVVGNGEPGLIAGEFTRSQVRTKEYTKVAHLWVGHRLQLPPARPAPDESRRPVWHLRAAVVMVLVVAGLLTWLAVNRPQTPTGQTEPNQPSPTQCDRYEVTARDVSLRDEAGNPTGEELAGGQQLTISQRRSESGPPSIWLATTDSGVTGWVDRGFLRPACR